MCAEQIEAGPGKKAECHKEALAGIQARNDGGLGHVSRSGRAGKWVDSRSFLNVEQKA